MTELDHSKSKAQRRTLDYLPSPCPSPSEVYEKLTTRKGWAYKTNMEKYLQRDRALASVIYVAELRVSEAIRLVKDQFKPKADHVLVADILLSKRKKGKVAYRIARLPLDGERASFTKLIMDYVNTLGEHEKLFPWSLKERVYVVKGHPYTVKGEVRDRKSFQTVGTKRAWQVVNALLPEYTEHWLRAFGEDYLYDHMSHDIIAVADEVKVDARTLQLYLRKRNLKYHPV